MEFSKVDIDILHSLAIIIIILLLLGIATFVSLIYLYFHDSNQSKSSLLRNYPVIGRFRYLFEFLGQFFRQYFFAADREELPFNRANRNWVYRAAKDLDTTVAFGSTRALNIPGTALFVNEMFPTLEIDAKPAKPLLIGDNFCEHPYLAPSFFNISGMSFGALSKPAVQALSKGAKLANCWLNTGEGGISPYHLEGNCDLIAQIGTAFYGYRDLQGNFDPKKLQEIAKISNVKMFEIKLSQGAKPGKGGLLPAKKVTPEIAKIRGIPEYQDSISPNRFPGVVCVDNVLDMVNNIRDLSKKPVGIKFVVGNVKWLHDLCKQIKKRGLQSAPDFLTIDSADGGTGAAPMPLIDYMGLPISESLAIVIDTLISYKLRNRIKIIASGKLINPSAVAWALCVGADFINSGRGFMFALGCIQALHCNINTCPTGVTTHNKRLQHGLVPEEKCIRVANYVKNLKKEVGQIAHSCGVKEPRQLQRQHCRIVQPNGKSISLEDLYNS